MADREIKLDELVKAFDDILGEETPDIEESKNLSDEDFVTLENENIEKSISGIEKSISALAKATKNVISVIGNIDERVKKFENIPEPKGISNVEINKSKRFEETSGQQISKKVFTEILVKGVSENKINYQEVLRLEAGGKLTLPSQIYVRGEIVKLFPEINKN
ncbi:MAG: hypothetical protein WC144_06130 [Sulfurimonas sp.]|jgi:hypothetical protein